jgi:putative ABC transport system permease protein
MSLATNSNLQFQTALAKLRAPDIALTIDAAKVTGAELARTSRLPGVTAAAGPYPQTTVVLTIQPAVDVQNSGVALTLVGRASRSGPLADIAQHDERWPYRMARSTSRAAPPPADPQCSVRCRGHSRWTDERV